MTTTERLRAGLQSWVRGALTGFGRAGAEHGNGSPAAVASAPAVGPLGDSVEARRFLLSVLLTTRYHLFSRPISFANDSFFIALAAHCDRLLAILTQPGGPRLAPRHEAGLRLLEPIAGADRSPKLRLRLERSFRQLFGRYFRDLAVPWSALTPIEGLTLDQWPTPAHVFFAIGPNIGIGDEMILFRAARRLARRYPGARLEVSSHHPTLWGLCDFVTDVTYPADDQLDSFLRARQLLAADPRTLVVFAEFASAPMYRHLELVPGFDRFVYLDTGFRTARLVDQSRRRVGEHTLSGSTPIYRALSTLLARIGLPDGGEDGGEPPILTSRHRSSEQSPPTVFVNPFSSKDAGLEPEWWAATLLAAAEGRPLRVQVFAGINERCRQYARAIAGRLAGSPCAVEIWGEASVPSIVDTLRAATESDLVLGLDTFTGHVNVLRETACVTLFLGSEWDAWRSPATTVLSARVYDRPEAVGRLVARLLRAPPPDCRRRIEGALAAVDALLAGEAAPAPAMARCESALEELLAHDPELPADFSDLPALHVAALRSALAGVDGDAAGAGGARATLRNAAAAWEACNARRWAQYWCARPSRPPTEEGVLARLS